MQTYRNSSAPRADIAPDAIRIRAIDAADAARLARFYADLSPESRHRRFLGTCSGLATDTDRMLCTPDHEHAEGLVAELNIAGPDEGRIVGHICLMPTDADGLELAIAVADAFQHRGIGRRLFMAALDWARTRGISVITATAFADNGAVLRLLGSAPEGSVVRIGRGDVVSIRIPLGSPPLEGRR